MATIEELRWLIAHDPCRASDRAPGGAVPAGTEVELKLRVDADALGLVQNAVVLTGHPTKSATLRWREFAMAPCAEGFAACAATAPDPAVIFYAFRLEASDGALFYYVPRADGRATAGELVVPGIDGEWTDTGWVYAESRLTRHEPGEFSIDGPAPTFQITAFDPAFETPDWMAGAIMYQIFPDRFARGAGGVRAEGLAYHERMFRPVHLHASWNDVPDWECVKVTGTFTHSGDEEAYDPVDFFGGTLAGIREQLPYVASLGVEALYLNPVCEARSNHRYDTADYEHIDPLLGTDEDYERLCAEAADLGIRVIFDAVLSHTGDDSRYFNAKGTYGELGAAQGADSPFRAWYDFEHPSEGRDYRCWWGFPSLPEVDEENPAWQRYIFGEHAESGARPSGVLPLWLARGAHGFRLDVADEIPDEVLERLRASVKGADSDAAIIGEVWEDATTKVSYGRRRTYALGRALDSVMNYPLRSALLGFATGAVDAQQLAAFLMLQQANYPEPLYRCAMNLLSSHDVERVRSVLALGGQLKQLDRAAQLETTSGITAEQDECGARLQALVVALLYALPGAPCIYYGDERGMQGGGDPFCRATFPWDGAGRADIGRDLTATYRELGQLRKNSPTLRTGALACFASGSDVISVVRKCVKVSGTFSHSAWVVVANRASEVRTGAFDLCRENLVARRVFGPDDAHLTCESGIVRYSIPPLRVAYFELLPAE